MPKEQKMNDQSLLINRLKIINNKISMTLLNQSFHSFKVKTQQAICVTTINKTLWGGNIKKHIEKHVRHLNDVGMIRRKIKNLLEFGKAKSIFLFLSVFVLTRVKKYPKRFFEEMIFCFSLLLQFNL